MSRGVKRTWIRTGSYGWFRGEWVKSCLVKHGLNLFSLCKSRLLYFNVDGKFSLIQCYNIFANGSKLVGFARLPEAIQSDLHCLYHWANAWQMKFIESKCSILHIGKDNPKSNYTMGSSPLQVVERERDLGVVVSAGDTLCCEEHI